ncbi:hypothetical protein O181_034695 [Austropuccinia psidii MF-1]|uniref:Uncharacterized protein n=1 Tax=Austropuccinia psidii MF-1 TaxID=1389203 RepID=A0A9Q3HAG8_9BASI|nr:hypothetical protein [Austropuccinia psidii MF-1]
MVQALDGGYIIPRFDILKLYIEQDLEAKVLIQQKEFSKPKKTEKKTIFEDESWEEALKQVKELTQKIENHPQPEPQPRNEEKESVKEALSIPQKGWKDKPKIKSKRRKQLFKEFQNSNIPKPDQPEEEIENIANKNEDEEIPKEEKKFRKPQNKKLEAKLEIEKIIKKIMQQKINLTIEEILRISPNFVHKLQALSGKDKEKIKSLNLMDLQEKLLRFGFKEIPNPKIYYTCPLGFMETFI